MSRKMKGWFCGWAVLSLKLDRREFKGGVGMFKDCETREWPEFLLLLLWSEVSALCSFSYTAQRPKLYTLLLRG